MLADVTQAIGKPAFWGRYLTGYTFDNDEVRLLSGAGIRLLPIYQGTTQHPGNLSGKVADGTADATAALEAAEACGVPSGAGVCLYADIEGSYTVSADWLSGWVAGIQKGQFIPGVYCGSDKTGFTQAYTKISHDDRVSMILWSNSPSYDIANHWSVAGMPTTMSATPISAGGGLHVPDLWQYALPVGDDSQQVDLDVCTQRAYAAMWAP